MTSHYSSLPMMVATWIVLSCATARTGHGPRDVLLTTCKEGIYKAYLYRNETAFSPSHTCPAGTGLNFTLY